jgi:hypothetical protein
MARGIYRVRDPQGRHNAVCVRYEGGADLEIDEKHYRAQGYVPALEALPWKEDYRDAISSPAHSKQN